MKAGRGPADVGEEAEIVPLVSPHSHANRSPISQLLSRMTTSIGGRLAFTLSTHL